MAETMLSNPGSFGGLLRRYRAVACLTQEELAERSGLSAQAISMLERGVRRAPRATTVNLLARALKLDESQRELLAGTARMQPDLATPIAPEAGEDGQTPGSDAVPSASSTIAVDVPTGTASSPRPRRTLWGRLTRLPLGQVAATLLIIFTIVIVHVWPWQPTASPSAPSLPRCTSPGHLGDCWATLVSAAINQDAPCPHQVPLFLRSSGHVCLGGNDLVQITCYYRSRHAVDGDRFQDHVIKESAGRLSYVGHIPDHFVDLGGHVPSVVGIRRCTAT